MTAVRHTPPRRRMTCPSCGRNVSYTHPWKVNPITGRGLVRDMRRRVLKDHKSLVSNPNGGLCPVNGPTGLGIEMERQWIVTCRTHGHYLVRASPGGTTWTDDIDKARRYENLYAAEYDAKVATWLDHTPEPHHHEEVIHHG